MLVWEILHAAGLEDLPEDSDPADWHIRMPRTLLDVVTQLLELMFARRKGAGNHFCEP